MTPHLVALFYAACVPIVAAGRAIRPETRLLWAALLLVWSTLWLILVGSGSI